MSYETPEPITTIKLISILGVIIEELARNDEIVNETGPYDEFKIVYVDPNGRTYLLQNTVVG